jgi:hypothetical protein
MKIGKTSYNVEAIKKLTFKEFQAIHKSENIEKIYNVYEQITGINARKKEAEQATEKPAKSK